MDEREQLAGAVREACVEAALRAYEEAGLSGLCAEGRWECAVGAMRQFDLEACIRQVDASASQRSAEPSPRPER